MTVDIIGGGLAGCEAAWQLLCRDMAVRLFEMKPLRYSAAHTSPGLAELVCSNSLRADSREHAAGLLKEELRRMHSLIMAAADANRVPAGKALAVDRQEFSRYIEEQLTAKKGFNLVRAEVTEVPEAGPAILATGPLTSDRLACDLQRRTGGESLYFYDAISPIVDGETIDRSRVFRASRYGTGEGDYLNCPLNEAEYDAFWNALVAAEEVPIRSFEAFRCFEGCLPVEVIAKRGIRTLAYGPMKPVGLRDPRTGRQPYAVVQLRQENQEGSLYNLVGFQTRLTWTAQKRTFRMIPGLEQAEFLRYGSVHRNTFVNAPRVLCGTLQLREAPHVYLAGQITGVEGYIESTAMGLLAGRSVACALRGRAWLPPPAETAHGALLRHITTAQAKTFQPMNVNFGIFPPLAERSPRRERGQRYASRALASLETWQRAAGE